MSNELTSTGLNTDSATEIKTALDASFKAVYGESIGANPDGSIPAATSIGQEIAIITDSTASAGEMLAAIVSAYDPDGAEDAALDVLCALTGTFRKLATFSQVGAACFGTAGTVLPVGRVATVQDLGTRFDSLTQVTLALVATTWAAGHVYAFDDLIIANGKVWWCIVGGTSDLYSGGPTGSGQQTDGSVTWYAVAPDTDGVALVRFQAEQTGPLAASQGQLNQIATPVAGWAGVVNGLGTDSAENGLGSDLESNASLRVRRVAELQAQGGGPADSIRAAILAITDVVACQVFANTGDVTDGNGLPPHSADVMILAPNVTDAVLGLAVWRAVAAGTATSNAIGTPVTVSVNDSSGNPQTVEFSRPTAVPISINVTVYYDPTQWPVQNVTASITAGTQSAICTFAAAYYQSGFNVRVVPLTSAITDGPQATEVSGASVLPVIPAPAGSTAMPGIVDVSLTMRRGADPFLTTPITIAAGEIATFDPANIVVVVSSEAP